MMDSVSVFLFLRCCSSPFSILPNRSKWSASSTAGCVWNGVFCRKRVFVYEGFLSNEECDHLIELAEGKLERATAADGTGKMYLSGARTSTGVFLRRAQDEVVANMEARIAAWTFLPEENGEAMQVLRYKHGHEFKPHWDFFRDEASIEFSGHRMATVVMYLSNVEKGGETVFFGSEVNLSRLANTYLKYDYSAHCDGRLSYAVKPKNDDALLFFSLHPNATIDISSMHAGCLVIDGKKWSATKWIHVRPFFPPQRYPQDGECMDLYANCLRLARDGKYERTNCSWLVPNNTKDLVGRAVVYVHLIRTLGKSRTLFHDSVGAEHNCPERCRIFSFDRRKYNTTNG